MIKIIARVFELLLRLLLPPTGHHRAADSAPTETQVDVPTSDRSRHAPAPPNPSVRNENEGVALVRPYLLSAEERRERRRQRECRRALWLAPYGVDVGPRWIHGVEVAS
jgi:hypothetical protein